MLGSAAPMLPFRFWQAQGLAASSEPSSCPVHREPAVVVGRLCWAGTVACENSTGQEPWLVKTFSWHGQEPWPRRCNLELCLLGLGVLGLGLRVWGLGFRASRSPGFFGVGLWELGCTGFWTLKPEQQAPYGSLLEGLGSSGAWCLVKP